MDTNPTAEQARTILRSDLPQDLRAVLARIRALPGPQDVRDSTLFIPLLLAIVFAVSLGVISAHFAFQSQGGAWMFLGPAIAAGMVVALVLALARLYRDVLVPVHDIRRWVARVMDGEMTANMPVPASGDCAALVAELNALSVSLGFLCVNLDRQTRQNMDQLAQKTRSLEILYDAAAGIDLLHDLDDLLTRFLRTLMDLSQARAGVVRLMGDDGQLRLVAASGIDKLSRAVPVGECLGGEQIAEEVLLLTDLSQCEPGIAQHFAGQGNVARIAIPVRYAGRTLGVYNLYVDDAARVRRAEMCQLFNNIGRHLGIAIEKARLERHARRLSIMEERTLLANELHDSLAQTLASLRFQISMAEESVSQSRDRTGIRQIRTIKEGLDQANAQLRELLAHFRTRMDERGLIPAIESLVDRFRSETGIATFFQNELSETNLPPSIEVQVLHIVQEALTNVRKHSGAQNVRVMLRVEPDERFHVMVEDDGQGIADRVIDDPPGEHIGLSIMRERAARLGGELTIESEPGEGTRVDLQFRVNPQRRVREREENAL